MAEPSDKIDSDAQENAPAGEREADVEYPGAVPEATPEMPVITEEDLKRERGRSRRRRQAEQKAAEAKAKSESKADGFLKGGLGAMRQVHNASKRHSDARGQVKSLKSELDESQKVLDHRNQIERDYQKILAEQTSTIKSQERFIRDADASIEELKGRKDALEAQLAQAKADHEEQLRPYRELMESTKGRADDAAKTLADTRRLAKSADQQLSDATKRREQSIASANRSIDNSQERLAKAEGELSSLQHDDGASASVVQKKQSDIVAERAHLDAARADLERVTAECKRLVESAQANLAAQRKALESAEATADATKREADARREEYEGLYNDASSQEKSLSDEIAKLQRGITTHGKERDEADKRRSEAQALLDEANQIHSTPEVTSELAGSISQGRQELAQRQRTVQRLAHDERRLRESTRRQRYLFVGLIVLVAVVVLAALFLMLL